MSDSSSTSSVAAEPLRAVRSEELAPKKPPTPLSTHSLPAIKIVPPPHARKPQGYVDLYASSYSDNENEDDNEDDMDSPIEAVVMGFERTAPKLPALRIGAARLSEMVHARATTPEPEPEPDSAPATVKKAERRRKTHRSQRRPQPQVLENDADGAAAVLPQRLARANTKRPTAPAENVPEEEDSTSAGSSQYSKSVDTLPPPELAISGEEEMNGLIAPGAFGDETQRARADGSRWQRFLFMLKGSRRERERKMFKPVVCNPNAKHRGKDMWTGDDDSNEGDIDQTMMSRFPFCCCAARYCVAISFAAIILATIVGFLVWPRVPSLSISSLTALEPARVIYNPRVDQYGLHMPMRVNYEIHSGNYYPLLIRRVHVLGFDGVTGNRIVDTTLKNLHVPPLRLSFHGESTIIHYLTSDLADPALADLFGKCAPKSAKAAAHIEDSGEGRPGALVIRFQIKVDVSNLGWLKQPIVTLNQKIECPE